jgi:hypothetical protein
MRRLLICALLVGSAVAQTNPTLYEKWTPPNGTASQTGSSGLLTFDNLFQVDGVWIGTGGATLQPGDVLYHGPDELQRAAHGLSGTADRRERDWPMFYQSLRFGSNQQLHRKFIGCG